LADGAPAERVALLVRESRYGLAPEELVQRTGLTIHELEQIAARPGFVFARSPALRWLDRAWFDVALDRVRTALRIYHKENPLLPGMPKEDLRTREFLGSPAPLLDFLLAAARDVVAQGDIVRLASHTIALRQEEQQAAGKMEAAFRDAGLAVPSTQEVLGKSGIEPVRARTLLQLLLREKKLVRVSEDLVFHESAIGRLREMLAARKGERFSVPAFKEWAGVSRKYAIPLLEYLDREKLTRREGDLRVVL
jgi:selenocysteine-specific elongation factor